LAGALVTDDETFNELFSRTPGDTPTVVLTNKNSRTDGHYYELINKINMKKKKNKLHAHKQTPGLKKHTGVHSNMIRIVLQEETKHHYNRVSFILPRVET